MTTRVVEMMSEEGDNVEKRHGSHSNLIQILPLKDKTVVSASHTVELSCLDYSKQRENKQNGVPSS